MAKVEIYSGSHCPYCVKAKRLLDSKGVEYTEYDVSDENLREEMVKRTGGFRSIPRIFINDIHYGGCDDLYAMNAAGDLDPLLKA